MRVWSIVLVICLLQRIIADPLVKVENIGNSLVLTTLYGTVAIDEPVLKVLIQHPAFERLRHIHQYGAIQYLDKTPFSRYEHSLGVFFLTRKFGAPLSEQIAALLHDISHTVFSHVGDVLFKSNYRTGKCAYQDAIHEWYLEKTGIRKILCIYGYPDVCTDDAKSQQRCFEQPLPDLCTDRIEYNLSGGLLDGLITAQEINDLLSTLHFINGQWFFDNEAMAEKFGRISLELSETRWGAAWNICVDRVAAALLQRALELKIITLDDIHFSTDIEVLEIMHNHGDAALKGALMECSMVTKARQDSFIFTDHEEEDIHCYGKFSGTDPLVMREGQLMRLTKITDTYRQEFERVRKLVARGWCVKFTNPCLYAILKTNNDTNL